MNRRDVLLAAFALPLALGAARAQPQSNRPLVGEMKPLGQDRYQIGHIVVDKAARRFTLPGRVLALGQPLEYLATTPGGMKAYETLFEVDATGSEFNLACILVGLETDPKIVAANRSGSGPLRGPRVAISVAWSAGGKRRQVSAAEAMLNPESGVKPESVEWVYTGAPAIDLQGRFPADVSGTLVGFKPDENNVIESSVGIGIGAYGSVRGNAMLPPKGSPIELIVDAAAGKK
jgi:hypothetical protein